MAQAYDFALEKIGMDIQSYSIWNDYVNFLKGVEAVGSYAENQKISAVRKVYNIVNLFFFFFVQCICTYVMILPRFALPLFGLKSTIPSQFWDIFFFLSHLLAGIL